MSHMLRRPLSSGVLVTHFFYMQKKMNTSKLSPAISSALTNLVSAIETLKYYQPTQENPLKYKAGFCTGPYIRLSSGFSPLLRLKRVKFNIYFITRFRCKKFLSFSFQAKLHKAYITVSLFSSWHFVEQCSAGGGWSAVQKVSRA